MNTSWLWRFIECKYLQEKLGVQRNSKNLLIIPEGIISYFYTLNAAEQAFYQITLKTNILRAYCEKLFNQYVPTVEKKTVHK